MSATSEELAAQAEQLQSSIAYFRIGATGQAVVPHRSVVASRRTAAPGPVGRAAAFAVAKPAPMRNGRVTGKPSGFSLDLTSGGADQRDVEFERM